MTRSERILLIRVGGTIDARPYADPKHPPADVTPLNARESLIFSTLKTFTHHDRVDGMTLTGGGSDRFSKDSKYITGDDLQALADIIRADDQHRSFILTHGTDAMVQNAETLQNMLKGSGKTVVFTGAMVPLSMHQKHKSDGVETLEFALDNIDRQPPGVHVLGRNARTRRLEFFDPAHVQKDREASLETLSFSLAAR